MAFEILWRACMTVVCGLTAVLTLLWLLLARPIAASPGSYKPRVSVDADALRRHVKILSEDFIPRTYAHPENMQRAAQYIADAFRKRAAAERVEYQEFTVGAGQYLNVISSYGPEEGAAFVIGAHYDVDGGFPGADDNASGVAGILELGRLLEQHPPPVPVILVAYALEEMPHFATESMGSFVQARSLRDAGRDVQLMISLEMIGYFDDAPGTQAYPSPLLRLYYPSRGNFIALVEDMRWQSYSRELKELMTENIAVPVYSINAPRFIPGIDWSDHRSYWEHGFRAVMVTDTSFYRNTAYHTGGDTYDRLDFERMAQVVYGVYSFVAAAS